MTDQLPYPADSIPPIVRTVTYLAALVVGALATAATALAAAVPGWDVELVAAVAGAVTGVVSTIAGGIGVVYRPTNEQRGDQP